MQPIITRHIEAVNMSDVDAIVDTFTDDALVNDNRREFWGKVAIRAWIAREIVGDQVTMKVTDARERGDEVVVRAKYDGNYDKTNLPAELILTNYFRIEHGKIKTLIVIRNQA